MLNLNFKDNKKLNEYYLIQPNLIDIKEDIKLDRKAIKQHAEILAEIKKIKKSKKHDTNK